METNNILTLPGIPFLQGSRMKARIFMRKYKIPFPDFRVYSNEGHTGTIGAAYDGIKFITADSDCRYRVIKTDKLAGQVFVSRTKEELLTRYKELVEGGLGNSSETVLLEEYLQGDTFSVFIAADNSNYEILAVPEVTDAILKQATEEIVEPTFKGLRDSEIPYEGCFMCINCMLVKGTIYVIEYM